MVQYHAVSGNVSYSLVNVSAYQALSDYVRPMSDLGLVPDVGGCGIEVYRSLLCSCSPATAAQIRSDDEIYEGATYGLRRPSARQEMRKPFSVFRIRAPVCCSLV
jgi:hypothetical protein